MIARNAAAAYYYTRRKYNVLRNRFIAQANISTAKAFAIVDEAIATHANMIGWASRD